MQCGIIIKVGQVEVYMVEYVLFVFFGFVIDNVFIQLDGLEVFILDGSVGFFVKVLQKIGIEVQDKVWEYFVVEEFIFYKDEKMGLELVVLLYDGFEVVVMIDFNFNVLGQ